MKKIAALIGLALALLVGAVPSVHAGIVPPATICTLALWTIDGNQVTTYEYNVTSLTLDDGTVYQLNTSDGSNYTLDFAIDGSMTFVTKWLNGTEVNQWITTEY